MTRPALVVAFGLLLMLAAGCGTPTPTPTPRPTRTPVPSPTSSSTPAPTSPDILPTPQPEPSATPLPRHPPADASLGDSWTRPADGMIVVYVPAGGFEMGSDTSPYNNERPVHDVTLQAFWLDRTEVTNSQYQRCVDAGVCEPPSETGTYTRDSYYGDPAYGDYPVVHVNWYRAVAYCQWGGARLPTEEEWAYAARGPESYLFPWGNQPDSKRLNYCDVHCDLPHRDPSGDDGFADTAPVGSFPAGASWCGALDMLGNVWEWAWDWFGYYPAADRPGWVPTTMTDRIVRGGGWDTAADHTRGTFRNWFNPAKDQDSIGFRCVLDER